MGKGERATMIEAGQQDLWSLYPLMRESRCFELAVKKLWEDGLISGEMHLGIGEEGIAAGVVLQLRDGDAMALDHRGTPELLMRGVDPVLLLRELLGRPDGLCGGRGGHMHLFSREHLACSSGIVGASGPAAAGFALAAAYLGNGSVAVGFFGEGALNQGSLMESMNLAAAWKLPMLFVCKDNDLAITTVSSSVTGATIEERVRGFGLPVRSVDGWQALAVHSAAGECLERARAGAGPSFLHARCAHPHGHVLGDPLVRSMSLAAVPRTISALAGSLFGSGARVGQRLEVLSEVTASARQAIRDRSSEKDPIEVARKELAAIDRARLSDLERVVDEKMNKIVAAALAPWSPVARDPQPAGEP